MSDRIKGLVVTLKNPMRDDDCESLMNAISLLKNVASIEPSLDCIDDQINRSSIKHELTVKIWEALK